MIKIVVGIRAVTRRHSSHLLRSSPLGQSPTYGRFLASGPSHIHPLRDCAFTPFPAAPPRFFHSSTAVQASRRRRRNSQGGIGGDISGGGEGGDDRVQAVRPTGVKDRALFLKAANSFFDRVEVAIEPMKACNDVFEVYRSSNEEGDQLRIQLSPGEGVYTLQADDRNFTMILASPMSGTYTYVLSDKTNEWLGMDDGHILEGMLVRDLIRHCNGVPKF